MKYGISSVDCYTAWKMNEQWQHILSVNDCCKCISSERKNQNHTYSSSPFTKKFGNGQNKTSKWNKILHRKVWLIYGVFFKDNNIFDDQERNGSGAIKICISLWDDDNFIIIIMRTFLFSFKGEGILLIISYTKLLFCQKFFIWNVFLSKKS